jgi:ribosomal protein S18 acetylase RimI-like enzyme
MNSIKFQVKSRTYSTPQDLRLMIDLLNIARSIQQVADYPSNVNLHELLQSTEIQANTRLWFNGEQLAAFALVDEYNNLLFDCLPDQLELLGDEFIEWGLNRLNDQAKTLDANCRDSDPVRVAFLKKHDFVRTPTETISMRRDLDEPIPNPVLPAGFVIRAVKGEEEAEALAELHRLAFGTEYATTEVRLTWMRVPDYDPSLDLVAIAPNGNFAAYCMCSINREQNQITGELDGQTDPVATHPHYQKMGLAQALLLTGLSLLKERGMQTASLGTSSDNIAMQKTAQAVGFYISHKKIWFEKAINKS